MLKLLLVMRVAAYSVSGIAGDSLVARHGIEVASIEHFGRHHAAKKAKTEGQSGFQMVLGGRVGEDLANHL